MSDSQSHTESNKGFFLVAFGLSGLYLLLYGTLFFRPVATGVESWILWVVWILRAMVVAPPAYTLFLWFRREELIALDRHMAYLPISIWYVSFILVQNLDGHGKSMSNGLFESMTVLTISGLYLVRFAVNSNRKPAVARRLGWLLFVVAAGAAATTYFWPPLPE